MSYSLLAKFVDTTNHKVLCTADVSFMKSLNERSYSNQFEDIHSTSKTDIKDYPEVSEYITTEFKDYYRKELLDAPFLKGVELEKRTKDYYGRTDLPSYVFDDDFLNEHEQEFSSYCKTVDVESYIRGHDDLTETDFIMVFRRYNDVVDGDWYTLTDFNKALPHFREQYEKAKERLNKLNSLKDTAEWFSMSEEARSNALSEISYCEEDVEDYMWKKEALEKMCNILSFFKYDVGYRKDKKETEYEWNYGDGREVEVFIEVC